MRNAIAIVTHKNTKPAESGLKKVCLLGSVENSGHFPLRTCMLCGVLRAQCNSHRNTQKHETRGIWLEKLCVFWDRSRIPGTFRCAHVYVMLFVVRNAIAIVTHKSGKKVVLRHKKVPLGCHNPAWDPLKRGPPPIYSRILGSSTV